MWRFSAVLITIIEMCHMRMRYEILLTNSNQIAKFNSTPYFPAIQYFIPQLTIIQVASNGPERRGTHNNSWLAWPRVPISGTGVFTVLPSMLHMNSKQLNTVCTIEYVALASVHYNLYIIMATFLITDHRYLSSFKLSCGVISLCRPLLCMHSLVPRPIFF